jgi:hypothetical protein
MTSVRTKVSLTLAPLLLLLVSSQNTSAWYDPGVQRWINRDPIGEIGAPNLYCFVLNRPILSVDPLGLVDRDMVCIPMCRCAVTCTTTGPTRARLAGIIMTVYQDYNCAHSYRGEATTETLVRRAIFSMGPIGVYLPLGSFPRNYSYSHWVPCE